ncbi:MAG: TPM domain-containing protein [Elusimicrobia bacterium]|nr:TPM domain-containing protein [Elusimicrobiota bacterium]
MAALEVPYLSGRVNDTSEMLTAVSRRDLERTLKDFEARTGHQAAVLIIPSLEREPLEAFSLKVARTWGLGQKGRDDGVLLLISKYDRKLRIEVGHGLEGDIPDALAGRIIDHEIVPLFRSGDFDGGVKAGVAAIIAAAQGVYTPTERIDRPALADNIIVGTLLFLIIGVLEIMGIASKDMGWFLFLLVTAGWAASPIAFLGSKAAWGCLVSFAQMLIVPILKTLFIRTSFGGTIQNKDGKIYYRDKLIAYKMEGGASGGFGDDSGSSGWGGGSSGSSGGSDFSGGGGSFGGGGASGSW